MSSFLVRGDYFLCRMKRGPGRCSIAAAATAESARGSRRCCMQQPGAALHGRPAQCWTAAPAAPRLHTCMPAQPRSLPPPSPPATLPAQCATALWFTPSQTTGARRYAPPPTRAACTYAAYSCSSSPCRRCAPLLPAPPWPSPACLLHAFVARRRAAAPVPLFKLTPLFLLMWRRTLPLCRQSGTPGCTTSPMRTRST